MAAAMHDPWIDADFEKAVRETAYFLWEQDGRPLGREQEYWFRALEQPCFSPLGCGLFADTDYLTRFGFIPSHADALNPDGWPIGFALDMLRKSEEATDALADIRSSEARAYLEHAAHWGSVAAVEALAELDGYPDDD